MKPLSGLILWIVSGPSKIHGDHQLDWGAEVDIYLDPKKAHLFSKQNEGRL